MSGANDDFEKLDAAMRALWHLGIIAVHAVGPERGDGVRRCRKRYQDAGRADSGYLGFCYYRLADVGAVEHQDTLDLVCGDFLDKNLVTRAVRDVVKDTCREAGLDAVAGRGSSNRVTLRSFRGTVPSPPPAPPLGIRPRPPQRLVAATTAVPGRSAPRRASPMSPHRLPPSPLDNLRSLALGMGAPPRIPDVPGAPPPDSVGWSRKNAGARTRQPLGRMPASMFSFGLASIVVGLSMLALLGDTASRGGGLGLTLAGCVLMFLGGRRRARPERRDRATDDGSRRASAAER